MEYTHIKFVTHHHRFSKTGHHHVLKFTFHEKLSCAHIKQIYQRHFINCLLKGIIYYNQMCEQAIKGKLLAFQMTLCCCHGNRCTNCKKNHILFILLPKQR